MKEEQSDLEQLETMTKYFGCLLGMPKGTALAFFKDDILLHLVERAEKLRREKDEINYKIERHEKTIELLRQTKDEVFWQLKV